MSRPIRELRFGFGAPAYSTRGGKIAASAIADSGELRPAATRVGGIRFAAEPRSPSIPADFGGVAARLPSNLIERTPMSESHLPRCPLCLSYELQAVESVETEAVANREKGSHTYECHQCGAIFTFYPLSRHLDTAGYGRMGNDRPA